MKAWLLPKRKMAAGAALPRPRARSSERHWWSFPQLIFRGTGIQSPNFRFRQDPEPGRDGGRCGPRPAVAGSNGSSGSCGLGASAWTSPRTRRDRPELRRASGTMEDKRNIQIIEWEHLDKKKFYVLGVAMTMMIRVSVYPFTLIRTRLQVQKGKSLYQGTFDAFVKILRADGVTGLYRGFLVNTFTLISGQCYVTTYELTRKFVADYSQSNTVKSLVAGGSASLVAQSITVPIDVVSQHLMMQRKGEKTSRFQVRGGPEGQGVVAFGQTKDIIRQILRADGLRGFYRGYVASLLTYIPNSAVWWPFYHFYAALPPLSQGVSSHCPSSHVRPPGRGHCFRPHQSHGCHPDPSAG
ncbi:solute carrier family 25 member 44 isoform X2 [Pteropus alecto]|uniref:solute carrier family 25 member 44 isoform X2 n=1 Tax=Pteropus alecto TaxID=9402 RepID=UPI00076861F8|nr:solute carrier family 25 member 44 isoform X2 [Pteropus alecto]